MSGSASERVAAVTASARSLPASMYAIDEGTEANVTCTCPPSRSVSEAAKPRYGTRTMSTPVITLNSSPARWVVTPIPPEFMEAYQAALGIGLTPIVTRRNREGTLAALVERFLRSADFVNLKARSQSAYQKALGPVLAAHGHRLVGDLEIDKPARLARTSVLARPPWPISPGA